MLTLLTWAWTASAVERGPDELKPEAGRIELAPLASVLVDPTAGLTLDQIRRPEFEGRFLRHQGEKLKMSQYQAAYWVRFRLPQGPASAEYPMLLEVGRHFSHLIDEIDLYIPLKYPDDPFLIKRAGAARPADGPDIRYRTCLLLIPADFKADGYFYLRLRSRKLVNEPLTLWRPLDFWEANKVLLAAPIFAFGILLAMTLYNMFIMFSLFDRIYLYYTLYMFFTLSWQFLARGYAHLFFDFPPGTYVEINFLLARGSGLFTLIMVSAFLRIRTTMPRVNYLVRFMIAAFLVSTALVLLGRIDIASPIGNGVGLMATVVLFSATLVRWRQGFKPARFMFLAWIFLAGGLVAFFLQNFQVIGANVWTANGYLFGSTLESIFLSFALADRIRELRGERNRLRDSERRYHELSLTDGLTGLYNKRYFSEKLAAEVELSRKLDRPLSLIMIDVDHFKRFNDAYGHPEGDKALAALSLVINRNCRSQDIPCRYGGEEFAVILPGTDAEAARKAAERIRVSFQEVELAPEPDVRVKATISLGAAGLQPGDDWENLLRRADQALYEAKTGGRNQVAQAS